MGADDTDRTSYGIIPRRQGNDVQGEFRLRTAICILKPIKQFVAKNADEVYEQIKAIHWEDYLDIDKTFAVDAVVFSEDLPFQICFPTK